MFAVNKDFHKYYVMIKNNDRDATYMKNNQLYVTNKSNTVIVTFFLDL